MANNEQTSESVASIAGRLLSSQSLSDAENWLLSITLWDQDADDLDKHHAMTLLGALAGLRKIAGSALTQARPRK